MIKTEQEIEADIYRMVYDSALAEEVSGGVYRGKNRPYNSKDEDITLKFLSGRDDQIQTGIVIMNIYVPDLDDPDGRRLADTLRIATLQRKVFDLIDSSRHSEYRLETDGSPTTLEADGINQHYINARLKFKRYTD